jgi:hypothetical protein
MHCHALRHAEPPPSHGHVLACVRASVQYVELQRQRDAEEQLLLQEKHAVEPSRPSDEWLPPPS